jgi:hypothetical protein
VAKAFKQTLSGIKTKTFDSKKAQATLGLSLYLEKERSPQGMSRGLL